MEDFAREIRCDVHRRRRRRRSSTLLAGHVATFFERYIHHYVHGRMHPSACDDSPDTMLFSHLIGADPRDSYYAGRVAAFDVVQEAPSSAKNRCASPGLETNQFLWGIHGDLKIFPTRKGRLQPTKISYARASRLQGFPEKNAKQYVYLFVP